MVGEAVVLTALGGLIYRLLKVKVLDYDKRSGTGEEERRGRRTREGVSLIRIQKTNQDAMPPRSRRSHPEASWDFA
ncbi:unnamed protein product [Pleuronectes platessa]|uniref:Uncharacterized protein n=1 Tax=Pleuronectes platessa TaxID=8262 RepID=A0A9N7Z2I3_PLEPL|nr:unnamed protein product [Pleuronectes platessa]